MTCVSMYMVCTFVNVAIEHASTNGHTNTFKRLLSGWKSSNINQTSWVGMSKTSSVLIEQMADQCSKGWARSDSYEGRCLLERVPCASAEKPMTT